MSNTSSLLKFGANKFLLDMGKSMDPFMAIRDGNGTNGNGTKLESSMSDNIEEVTKKLFDDSGAINFNGVGSLVSITIWGLFIAKAKQGLTAASDSSSTKSSYGNFVTLFVLLAAATLTKFMTEGAPNAVLQGS
jgi:hypothetical protein